DEAQNTTPAQMKMFLTRIGFGTKVVITGDRTQKDLPKGTESGLDVAAKVLAKIDEIGFIQLTAADVVRHPLVQKIVTAYEAYERKALSNTEKRRVVKYARRNDRK
ncbi:MAG: PhoH family protein, partial [bacterium]